MGDNAPNPLSLLRKEYKALSGKNPSPKLDATALEAKIAELQAAPPADPAASPPESSPAAPPAPPPAAPTPGDHAPKGTVYLKYPEGIGCSFRGVELAADKKGRVLAPADAAAELAAHGFEAL